jgi:glycine/D-amino acid oxidase-like deaminating enzyme
VRLEAERVGSGGDKLVVHDYGHGGAGVTLSWGCADDVVALVREGYPRSLNVARRSV